MLGRIALGLALAGAALPAAASEVTPAQPIQALPGKRAPAPSRAYFVELLGGPQIPIGSWSSNAAFPDEDQFSLGGGGRVAVGWTPRQSRYFAIQLEGGYTELGTSSWEEFSKGEGRPLEAEARMWNLAVGGTVSIPGRDYSDFGAELHGALGVLVPSGQERFVGSTYEYEFLRTTMAGWLGARFVYRLGSGFDAWAGADFLVAPGGVQHRADDRPRPSLGEAEVGGLERRSILAVEPGFALRYWFGP